jgi:cyclic pyranopterin phosphate synthase
MPKPANFSELLTWEEIFRLVRIGVDLGINKVRLTGGEPLCRKGLVDFIEKLYRFAQLKDISLTTNGTLLEQHAAKLKQAGLKRINISLDTLDRLKYKSLTGVDYFDAVWQGILYVAQLGFDPIKINMVVMKGVNDDELEEMARLSMRFPFHIRFIEYMPIGTDPLEACNHFMSIAQMQERLNRLAPLSPIGNTGLDGPARRFRFENAPGEIGLIGSMSAHFCSTCNRLRLTANGNLRPCLLADESVNVLIPLRAGATDEDIAAYFKQTIKQKRSKHLMGFTRDRVLQTKMVSIGG